MSNDDVRKLLGGYATNTLTEAERKALFDAALDDQELFDALHQEQALKDLLDDPVSRDQVRRALEAPAASARWPRWWTWTGAVGAVAAAVLLFAVLRPTPPLPTHQDSLSASAPAQARPAEKLETDSKVSSATTQSHPEPARLAAARTVLDANKTTAGKPAGAGIGTRNERKDEIALSRPPVVNAPPPSPAPPATQQAQASNAAATSNQTRASDTESQNQQVLNGQAQNQVQTLPVQSQAAELRDQKQNQLGGAVAGFAKPQPLAMSYSVLKRDLSGAYQPLPASGALASGDEVRLRVAPTASGYLTLSRRDADGQWIRMFPVGGPGLLVNAHSNYTIPDAPITVSATDQNLRLTLLPAAEAGAMAARQFRAKAKMGSLKKESPDISPIVVDITIAPRKVP